MKTNAVKQTRTTKSITWNTSLMDDNGKQFATMTGTLDSARPLGNATFTVINPSVFEANKADAQAAYAAFQMEVNKAASETELATIVTEGEEAAENNEDAE